MSARPRAAAAIAAGCLALAMLPALAGATQNHVFAPGAEFGSPGSGTGQLELHPLAQEENEPGHPFKRAPGSGLAVSATGDLYVADTGNHRVDEFDPSRPAGEQFLRAFGWEVNASEPKAELQVCTAATGCQAGSSGAEPGQLEAPIFIAVDDAPGGEGDLYVGDLGDGLVTKFDPEGQLVSTWGNNGPAATPDGQLNGSPTEPFGSRPESSWAFGSDNIGLNGLAVDASGRLSLLTGSRNSHTGGYLSAFDRSGSFSPPQLEAQVGAFDAEVKPGGLLLDPTGDFYYDDGGDRLAELGPAGAELGVLYLTPGLGNDEGSTFGNSNNHSIVSGTRDPATGDLYLAEDVDGNSTILDISSQCQPSATGCLPSQEFGSGHLTEAAGLALTPDGTLYAADTATGQIAVFIVSLEATTHPATEEKATSALLHATLNPRGGEVTLCSFQYGPTASYGRNLPCLDEAGDPVGTLTGESPIAVHAEATGLEGGATYHYRLHARTASGEELHSEDEEFETLVLPRIGEEEATELSATGATLNAKIDPQGPAVEACQIEWGQTSEPSNPALPYEHTVPCEPASLPAGTEPKPISLHLTGLSAQTTYHWRVAATDASGTQHSPDNTFVFLPGPPASEVDQSCANQALREANASTALPDCRAYEQVTPPAKNGALFEQDLIPYTSLEYGVSADGSRVFASTVQCFGGAPSCPAIRGGVGTGYEFSRDVAGWSATPVAAPAGGSLASTVRLGSIETGSELFGLSLSEPPALEGREWFYVRHADAQLEPIGPIASGPGIHVLNWTAHEFLATADLSHLIYNPPNLWPSFDSTTSSGGSLYEYAGAAQHPFLVAVTGERGSTELIGACGSRIATDSLSADGSTVYFEVVPCAGGTGQNAGVAVPEGALYARIDGEGPEARTVKISGPAPEPQCDASCQAQPPAAVHIAATAADGARAYFLSNRQLTDEAAEDHDAPLDLAVPECTAMPGSGCNLYLYTNPQEQPLAGDHLTDVSAGDTSGQGPQVQGVVAASEDGSRVYFVAKGLLAGKNAQGAEPQEGAANLYVYDAAEASLHFVGTLSPKDSDLWEHSDSEGAGVGLTPDGRFLLFTSHAGLTPDATRAEGPAQVYRYEPQTEALVRISIGQRGFADNGNAGSADAQIVSKYRGERIASVHQRPDLSISANGRRVFFESPVGLTPGALDEAPVNHKLGIAENIYEWEQSGEGSCGQAAGCLYLISDGRDVTEGPLPRGTLSGVELLGADADGENVFFTTGDQLTPTDTDTARDIYDARALGGFAAPPRAVPCETSEACHPGASEAGPFPQPASNVFNPSGPPEGPNNPQKPSCRKGQVKKHGKCASKKPHKNKAKHKKRSAGRANPKRRAGR